MVGYVLEVFDSHNNILENLDDLLYSLRSPFNSPRLWWPFLEFNGKFNLNLNLLVGIYFNEIEISYNVHLNRNCQADILGFSVFPFRVYDALI